MPPWDELVIYELHVGTFNDAPGGSPGGFISVTARLDYLGDLGINAIEVLPFAEFATDFSWGYNPSHIFAIEGAYGGPMDLKRLIRAAHERASPSSPTSHITTWVPVNLDLWQSDGWSDNGKGWNFFLQ